MRVAGHLAELAWLAAPEDLSIQAMRKQVLSAPSRQAASAMDRECSAERPMSPPRWETTRSDPNHRTSRPYRRASF
jgi:hypothetical protein